MMQMMKSTLKMGMKALYSFVRLESTLIEGSRKKSNAADVDSPEFAWLFDDGIECSGGHVALENGLATEQEKLKRSTSVERFSPFWFFIVKVEKTYRESQGKIRTISGQL